MLKKAKELALKEALNWMKSNSNRRLADPKLHLDYQTQKLDRNDEYFKVLHNDFHSRHVHPLTLSSLEKGNVIRDSVVELGNLRVNIDLSLKGLRKGAYGQYVSPIDV